MKRRHDSIRQLQADRRLQGQCARCGEAFPLADALLFYADEGVPEEVQKVVARRKEELAERRRDLLERRRRAHEVAERITVDVNLGKILEKIAPVFEGFGYRPRDCRGLFEPIDYVVFDGLSATGEVEALAFVDIKTGGGGLNQHQRQIRDAVEAGKVTFETYELPGPRGGGK